MRILTDFVRAVLRTGNQTISELLLLNPFNEMEFADDKLSIFDIKARDQTGQQVNIEMQLFGFHVFLQRVLYYWADLHASQLTKGDEYVKLRPTISIAIVNNRIFPEVDDHHHLFQIRSVKNPALVYCSDLSMYVIELPKFKLSIDELRDPLDVWCYFLKHGEELDKNALPEVLNTPHVFRALEELEMLSQNEQARERYKARLKWERDQTCYIDEARAMARQEGLSEGRAEGLSEGRAEGRAEGLSQGLSQGKLISRIQMLQEMLGKLISPDEELVRLNLDELRQRVSVLEQQRQTRRQ